MMFCGNEIHTGNTGCIKIFRLLIEAIKFANLNCEY